MKSMHRIIGTMLALGAAGLAHAQVASVPSNTPPAPAAPAARHTFAIGDTDFLLDGQRLQIRCGEVHAARVPAEYWRDRLRRAHAMGLNTVCAYLFWNMQEPKEGQFNWTGQGDIAQFCKIAQEEGLWVILRPGPYACAEWEMGGLPWWLLKNDSVKLRTSDPNYLNPAKAYLKEVGRVLAPLQITHGGPIIMVQAENEYGSFGNDANYMGPPPATGRYFCLEAVNAQDGKQFAAMAELDLLDKDGKPISHQGWSIAYVDSEERAREDGSAQNAIDGQNASFWHTQWGDAQPDFPHRFILDLGQSQTISAFRYVPRQGAAGVGGRIKDYRVFVGDGLVKK